MMIRLEIGGSIMSLVNILFCKPPIYLEMSFPMLLYRKCHTLYLKVFPCSDIS